MAKHQFEGVAGLHTASGCGQPAQVARSDTASLYFPNKTHHCSWISSFFWTGGGRGVKSAALILLTTGMVLGASMVQTDWSGGPSGEITTTDWGSDFGSCYGMGWKAQGALTLGTALDWAKVSDVGSSLLRTCSVNGDDFSDLFSNRTSIWAYESNGNPWNWPSHLFGSANNIRTIFAGDLTGDGLDEAIGGADSLFWWENPGNPDWDWQKRLVRESDLMAGAVLDYDGDGENDIICIEDLDGMYGQLVFYRNLGEGMCWERNVLYQSDCWGGYDCFTLQDVDNDGYLTATMLTWNGLVLIKDSPSGWSHVKTIYTFFNLQPQFFDFDNDGVSDYLGRLGYYPWQDGSIRWYKGPAYYPYTTYEIGEDISGLSCIDFDSDGDMDIIYRGENSVGMFENTRCPQERFVQRVLMEYAPTNGLDSESAGGLVAPGDFDGDGVEDFVCELTTIEVPISTGGVLERITAARAGSTATFSTCTTLHGERCTWDASVPAETQL